MLMRLAGGWWDGWVCRLGGARLAAWAASARRPDKLTAHPELIVLALSLAHLTGCGQPWVSGCFPDAAAPYSGYVLTSASPSGGGYDGESAKSAVPN